MTLFHLSKSMFLNIGFGMQISQDARLGLCPSSFLRSSQSASRSRLVCCCPLDLKKDDHSYHLYRTKLSPHTLNQSKGQAKIAKNICSLIYNLHNRSIACYQFHTIFVSLVETSL